MIVASAPMCGIIVLHLMKTLPHSFSALDLIAGRPLLIRADRLVPHPDQPATRASRGRSLLRRSMLLSRYCQRLLVMPIPGRPGWYYNFDGNRRLGVLTEYGVTLVPVDVLPAGTDPTVIFQAIQSNEKFTTKDTLASFALQMSQVTGTAAQKRIVMQRFLNTVPHPRTRQDIADLVDLVGLKTAISYGMRGTVSANIMTRLRTFVAWVGQMPCTVEVTDTAFQVAFVDWMITTHSYKTLGEAEKQTRTLPREVKQHLIDEAIQAFAHNTSYVVTLPQMYIVPRSGDVAVTVGPGGMALSRT